MKLNFLPVVGALMLAAATQAQPVQYTTANAHSHNDYEQQRAFFQAYDEAFGSIEADIFLFGKELRVAHEVKEINATRTLESLYLTPLANSIARNHGYPYADTTRSLQLLIDIKTEAVNTLKTLVEHLQAYPSIIHNKKVKLVISGNRPKEAAYGSYPNYIWFDGRLGETYTPQVLKKIALLSEDLGSFVQWDGQQALDAAAVTKLSGLISKSHQVKKPVRFWATPDTEIAWEQLMALKVDYINTDHIGELSDYLARKSATSKIMPFNRVIESAGTVVRFGDPHFENHALDLAPLPGSDICFVEDRYGVLALNIKTQQILDRWTYINHPQYGSYNSVYSGIKCFTEGGKTWVVWTAANRDGGQGVLMMLQWNQGFSNLDALIFDEEPPAGNSLPNGIELSRESDGLYLYFVLNGNNELVKIKWADQSVVWRSPTGVAPYAVAKVNNHLYVTNWAGSVPTDSTKERAGVPWGLAYTDPRTGATGTGSVSVFEAGSGKWIKDIPVGLHPNAIIANGNRVYVANGSSDQVSVINAQTNTVVHTIDVGLMTSSSLQGSTPNALALQAEKNLLFVANGFDNAIALVDLSKPKPSILGYIPTEAYPGGVALHNHHLVVANLESEGVNVIDAQKNARSIHQQLGSVSIIPLPDKATLKTYTERVVRNSLKQRIEQAQLPARTGIAPKPIPERLGEPSVFKHVVYIIKENKTYDQVYGDLPRGNGDSSLTIFGRRITPNMHALAEQYGWMDDYYASGKSSAEGHQWTDAGMVSDYVEKSVRAWFRSYPHRQEDALVYNKSGFIWNQAMDHGKTVRIFGEACTTQYDQKLKWADIYAAYKNGKVPAWYNTSTIARIRPIISPDYPDCDNITFTDQIRADVFEKEWKRYEAGDSLPDLLILSLPNDHSAGTSPDFPTPNSMVADNDLAVGRIVELITKSKYWDSTVIFITQDDSQSGWDHVSAYRTVGLVISPYSTGGLVSTHYNQTSMLRTIEQILGIPPMNAVDATSRVMTDCFQAVPNRRTYTALANQWPLDEMNKGLNSLNGKARKYALQSMREVFNEVDGGEDDTMNRIIWFYARGNEKYPTDK